MMKTARISLSNILLIASVLMALVYASYAALGVVFIMALHANAKRLSAYKRQEQVNAKVEKSEVQEDRLARVESEMQKVTAIVNISKLGR